ADLPQANALSFDVEEYFQVQALADKFPRTDWQDCASRVETSVGRILELLAQTEAHATFFTLGWIAERHPGMVREIAQAGHEIASHGYAHHRVDQQSPDEFRADVRKSKAILENCIGRSVLGFRAATFSMGARTPWAFGIL